MIASGQAIAADAVADHYDELDPFYRSLWGEHVHHGYWRRGDESPEEAVVALIDLLAERTGIRRGMAVCDVGCGYGATAAHLAAALGVQVVGLTLSPVQAARAAERARGEPALAFRCRDWLDNGLPSGAFDAVIAIESTEHMADKARAFAEAYRVLRPGGRLGICAWLAAERPRRWQVRHLLEPICREGRLPELGSAGDYRRLAHEAGFGDIALMDISAEVARTWTVCGRRLAAAILRDGAARRYLLDRTARNRDFAASLPRLVAAYRTGAMRYGILTATRPA